RRRISLQQRCSAHEDAGDAIAALQRLFGDEGALQRVRPLARSQSLDGGDILVRDRPQRRIAGRYRAIADDDIAGATLTTAAAEMRPGDVELSAQNIQQRPIGIGVNFCLGAVKAKSNAWHRGRALLLRLLIAAACRTS